MMTRMLHVFLALFLIASEGLQSQARSHHAPYEKPSHISPEVWKKIEPNLLPKDHPARKKLDRLFAEGNTTQSLDTFKQAGFHCRTRRTKNNVTVGKHHRVKGYVLKLFTDEQPIKREWEHWLKRIRGAEFIAQVVKEKGYNKTFKTPKKWIYPLPSKTHEAEGHTFILVCEDMRLVSSKKNFVLWKKVVTPAKLDALYDVLKTAGLNDSVYITNIPFAKDGRIAFVDTEHFQNWGVPYKKLAPFLSEAMQKYWDKITYTPPV